MKQIKQVPFNYPRLKEFSLEHKRIVTARTDKKWWDCPTCSKDEYWTVKLTHKGEVYATGQAQLWGACALGSGCKFWEEHCDEAGFNTGEDWYKAFMSFRRGHEPDIIYVIGITNIQPR